MRRKEERTEAEISKRLSHRESWSSGSSLTIARLFTSNIVMNEQISKGHSYSIDKLRTLEGDCGKAVSSKE